jgi:cholesterol transport system auxiliary component
MQNSIRTALRLFIFALSFTACSIGPKEQSVPRIYLLNPLPLTSPAHPTRSDAGTLLLSLPKAQPGFDTKRMAYLLRPHELSYYAFNEWADTPARMFHSLLVQTMEKAGLWQAVVPAPSPVRSDYRLDCDSLVLEQQFFSPSRVRLALRAQLIDLKRQLVMDAHGFEVFENTPSDDAYGGVIAANRAAARVLASLAEWVSTVLHEDTKRGNERPVIP